MKIRPLSIAGAFEISPQQHGDPRGLFMEWYRSDRMTEAVGHPLDLAQANLSISAAGVVRGIHFADVPVGQAKYVTCPTGAVLDLLVDIRVGSPTFGEWEFVRIDDVDRRAVYVPEGVGHGYCALTDGAQVLYLCSAAYNPSAERTVHPLDPELGITWPVESPQLSERDKAAPSLKDAAELGILPDYQVCLDYIESLRRH